MRSFSSCLATTGKIRSSNTGAAPSAAGLTRYNRGLGSVTHGGMGASTAAEEAERLLGRGAARGGPFAWGVLTFRGVEVGRVGARLAFPEGLAWTLLAFAGMLFVFARGRGRFGVREPPLEWLESELSMELTDGLTAWVFLCPGRATACFGPVVDFRGTRDPAEVGAIFFTDE